MIDALLVAALLAASVPGLAEQAAEGQPGVAGKPPAIGDSLQAEPGPDGPGEVRSDPAEQR